MSFRNLFAALALALFAACSSTTPTIPSDTPDSGVPGGGGGGGGGGQDGGGTGQGGDDGGTATEDGGVTTQPDAGTGQPDAGEAIPVVRFIAAGDTGKGNTGQTEVANAMAAKCALSGCDFVILLGDNIYQSGVESVDDPQWQTKFEVPYANVNVPFYAVLGNHDYGAEGVGSDFDRGPHQVEYSQKSTKWRMPDEYYQFSLPNAGHVDFFALDTNMQMYHLASGQESDVQDWLAASTATWKIVFGHHPYLSNGPHGNAGEYDGVPWVPIANGAGVKSFAEDVWCGEADFYISGHDHTLQWLTDTCQGTELIVSGTGAAATELEGSNPTHFQSLELGFVWVEIEGNTFTAEFVDRNGNVMFTRTVSK